MRWRKRRDTAPSESVSEAYVLSESVGEDHAGYAVQVVATEASRDSTRLADLLRGRSFVEVVATVASPEDTLLFLKNMPRVAGTVCLVDLGLPRDAGLQLIRTLRERYPSLVVLACSDRSDQERTSEALFMGADGYVELGGRPEALHQAVLEARRGDVTLVGVPDDWSTRVTEPTVTERPKAKPVEGGLELTGRELEILTIAAEGITARSISERLRLSERTVTTHLANIYRKLGARNRTDAVTSAMRLGLIDTRRTE
jgi:DNA-binding NarL/FixJ family response regulator